jgi:hypothetical protein
MSALTPIVGIDSDQDVPSSGPGPLRSPAGAGAAGGGAGGGGAAEVPALEELLYELLGAEDALTGAGGTGVSVGAGVGGMGVFVGATVGVSGGCVGASTSCFGVAPPPPETPA